MVIISFDLFTLMLVAQGFPGRCEYSGSSSSWFSALQTSFSTDAFLPRTSQAVYSTYALSSPRLSQSIVSRASLPSSDCIQVMCYPSKLLYSHWHPTTYDSVLTYLDISAVSVGISPDFSFYLLSIANASSGFGRYATGFTTDRFGMLQLTDVPAFIC